MSNKDLKRELIGSPGDNDNYDDDDQGYLEIMERMEMNMIMAPVTIMRIMPSRTKLMMTKATWR